MQNTYSANDTLFFQRYFSEVDLFFDVLKEEIFLHDLGWSRYDVIFSSAGSPLYIVLLYVTSNIMV